jgi:hypothetical protein
MDEPTRWQDFPTSGDYPMCIGPHVAPRRGRLHDLIEELDPKSADYIRLMALWAASSDFEVSWCDWCGEWRQVGRRRRRRPPLR